LTKNEIINKFLINKKQECLIDEYLTQLLEFSTHTNLVGRSTLVDPWQSHVLDCLQILPLILNKKNSILDMGTGAGLPGFLLKICGCENVTLVDSNGKKINFLQLLTFAVKLNDYNFTKIYDLHGSLRSFIIKKFNRTKSFTIRKLRFKRFLIFNFKINLFKKNYDILNEFDRILKINDSFLNIKNKTILKVSNNEKKNARKILNKYKIKKDFIVIVPGAMWKNKMWTLENYNKLIPLLKHPIVLLGSKNDLICDDIYNSNKNIINLKDKTDLRSAFAIISLSKIIVGSDTGLLHASEALGKSVVLISGPTSYVTGGNTRNENSETISHDIWCSPCYKNGQKKCIRSQKYCMVNLSELNVFKSINRVMEKNDKNNMDNYI